jgi:type IV pilus assembly protein PilQ
MAGIRGWINITSATLAVSAATSCATRDPKHATPAAPVDSAKAATPAPNVTPTPTPDPSPEPPPIRFSAEHDQAIREIFDLAKKGQWEDAELRSGRLVEQFPDDTALARLHSWVTDNRKILRERAVEDRIREIDSKNSPFNPTIASIITEQKDRGLTPRKDLRDAVQQIESVPYVPPSYGRKIEHQGFLASPSVTEGPMADLLNRRVDIHLDDVTLEQIIFELGTREKINFVADKALPAFQKKLSVNFVQVRLREFLDYVSRNLGLRFQVGEDLIWIVDGADAKNALEETRIYRLRRGFVTPARFADEAPTRVEGRNAKGEITAVTTTEKLNLFVPDNAPEKTSLETAIVQFFKGSKYHIDYERNLIVASGTRDQLEGLEQLIEEFDKPIQQVLIEARFITVTEPAFLRLGVAWETGRNLLPQQGVEPQDFTKLSPSTVALPISENFTNILNRENLSATITALNQSGESQTLSAPRLLLINNRPGKISDGKIQYYFEQYTVKQSVFERGTTSSLVPDGKPTKITSGVELNVVASIAGDGESILLALNPKVTQDVQLVTFATVSDVNDTGQVTSKFDIRLPEMRTQELSTRVGVKTGETVVMGGVLERNQTTFVESVPILGSIPLIGSLFRRRTEIDSPRYLLIFVTATIVSESGEFVLPKSTEKSAAAAKTR